MGFRIVWTLPALQELEELVRFIAIDDPTAGMRMGNKIVDQVEILRTFPELGPVYRRRTSGEVRQITCRPFRIFYRVNKQQQWVEVLHVWHGARGVGEDLV